MELTTLQEGVEQERKLIHRGLFGNEKANHVSNPFACCISKCGVCDLTRGFVACLCGLVHERGVG